MNTGISIIRDHEADTAFTASSLSAAFASACARWRDRTALTLGAESMTYAELFAAADALAAQIHSRSLPKNALVAILLPRSFDMVIAMLGVIRAGAAYLPIDPTYPETRIRETLEDSGASLLITHQPHRAPVSAAPCPVLCLDSTQPEVVPTAFAEAATQRNDLAYVIYTSGSTGRPKGVMVAHGNVLRLLESTEAWFRFNEHDVWTMFHSFAFDFSVWEMWGSLLTGARLVIVPHEISRSPEEFHALLAVENVTVLNQTPSAFSLLQQADAQGPLSLSLRYVIFGGEALVLRSLQPWVERHGDAAPQLINMYGITETTVHVTYRRIFANDIAAEQDSLIGVPIPDLQIYLLDEHLRPVGASEVGEICVGGAGVALGYLGRSELTAQRFAADPFGATGAKLYRSGDLARRRHDGELVYLGRGDSQVKINGFRIELGEIEAALLALPDVFQCCVVPHTDVNKAQTLAAYIVTDTFEMDVVHLRSTLRAKLPAHMVPSHFVQMAQLPLTGNGKVDRKALPAPTTPASNPLSAAAGATTEERVAAQWCAILHLASVDHSANFFDVGGTSLRLIALRNSLQKEFDCKVPVTWMFECTTVRTFAERVATEISAAPPSTAAATSAHQTDIARRQRESFARMRTLRSVAS